MDLRTAKMLLANQSKEELASIITCLVNTSEDAEEWFLNYCDRHCKPGDDGLIIRKQIEHYWDVAEEIIDDANMYGGTGSEEDGYDALFAVDDLIKKNKQKLDWDFRQSIINRMLEQFHKGNSGFEDTLIDLCKEFCEAKDEYLYLAGKLSKSSDSYYQNFAADLYLKYGEGERFAELQSRNLHYTEDYIHLADYYIKQKQNKRAVQLVEEAVEKVDGSLCEAYKWLVKEYKKHGQEDELISLYNTALRKNRDIDTISSLMYEYYESDYEKKKPYLFKTMETCDSKDAIRWFEECRNILLPEDYKKNSLRLHELLKKKNPIDYLQVRIDEGGLNEVLRYLQEHPIRVWDYYYNADCGHRFSIQLVDRYPGEICVLYWNECESLCATTDKKYYPRVVTVLKEIKSICEKNGMDAEWQSRYDSFLERHGRKKLLMARIAGDADFK